MNAYRFAILLTAGLCNAELCIATAVAQDTCSTGGCMSCQGREYRLVYQTKYEQRQVTSYRLEYETAYEDRRETRYRPVYETQLRERRYTVTKPILETAEREERFTVMKPVCETSVRDESYDVVQYVQETAEREERYIVNRPVTETAEREVTYTVQRPVCETVMRPQCRTVLQPVVTQRCQLVDQGCYHEQTTFKPSLFANRLEWQSGATTVDPLTGAAVYHSPGLYWTPTNRGTYEVNRVWQPNVVTQQVQQVAYVPQTVTEQVPVQVTSYRAEQVVQKVPYQTCRIVQQEMVRKVPYTVSRPVTQHVDRKVPVQTTRMVAEEQVSGKVPYQTCRMVCRRSTASGNFQVPLQVCRMESYEETVRIPHVVEKRIPVTCNYTVPHVECFRVPVDDCCTSCPSSCPSTGCDAPASVSSGCGVPVEGSPVVTMPGGTISGGSPAVAPTKANTLPASPSNAEKKPELPVGGSTGVAPPYRPSTESGGTTSGIPGVGGSMIPAPPPGSGH